MNPAIRLARIDRWLSSAPPAVRAAMAADAEALEPGAAAAVGRFFTVLRERREPLDAPSRGTFDAAARSEPTLATLLRALARYAPLVSTAAGREARAAWYRKRCGGRGRRRGESPLPAEAPTTWPDPWRAGYARLLAARIAETSRRTYVRQATACALRLAKIGARPVFDRWTAWLLFEVLEAEGKRPATVANYLGGFHAIARCTGAPPDHLAGIADIQAHAQRGARAVDALKTLRVAALEERGGYERIVATIVALVALVAEADEAPAWTAAAADARRAAAVLAVALNAPSRTGDMSRWRFGRELIRCETGAWRLRWVQGKTGGGMDMGELWPELWPILDAWLLCGGPPRLAQVEYRRLGGLCWLTRSAEDPQPRLASMIVREAIGAPLHDLRTLAADCLRDADPRTAPNVVSTLLGHRFAASSAAFRATAEGRAAVEDWRRMRAETDPERRRDRRANGVGRSEPGGASPG